MRKPKTSSLTPTPDLATQLAYGPHLTLNVSLSDALAGQHDRHEPTPTDPATKLEADYRPAETPDETCGVCQHFSDGRCELVVGKIDAGYVCDWWQARRLEGRTK